jgi:triacylglycerol lipase
MLKLHMEEAIASPRRIWLRGRLMDLALTSTSDSSDRRWWTLRRKQASSDAKPPSVRLETRISGQVCINEFQPKEDGGFELKLATEPIGSKKGWRLARNRVAFLDQTSEQCALVVYPPEQARTAILVIVPPGLKSGPTLSAQMVGSIVHGLERRAPGGQAYYYLAASDVDEPISRAELGLIVSGLGWPAGNAVVLAKVNECTSEDIWLEAIDRLRWVFAGALDVIVVSGDRSFADLLRGRLQPEDDRARVSEILPGTHERLGILDRSPQRVVPVPLSRNYRPTRASHIPRHPVIFCHGMLAFTTLHLQLPANLNCFSPLSEYLRQCGFRVLFPQVAPTKGVADRAAELRDQVRGWTDEPVNVIAHSMGGLDARYLITHLGMADRVRSLTTVATPHHGTHLVDWFLTNFHRRVPLLRAFEALGVSLDGFRDCKPETCVGFNAATPDMPGVAYFSYGGAVPVSRVTPVLRRAWSLLTAVEGPNDGMVSDASAHWGQYIGTVHADHFAQTPDMTFVRPGEDFDAAGFYCGVLEDLARRGF